ncbi:MAG: mshD [Francisellaceae bacterium]|nr:mshD [Francisellaceae bacterium]
MVTKLLNPHHTNIKAFTLIELVMAIVIIGVSVTGVLMAITNTTKFSSDPLISRQGIAIAESYLEEIMNQSYPTSLPCPAPNANGRSAYTNVCDYKGLSNTGTIDQTGAAIPGLGSYSVTVNIDTSTASTLNALRIDVTVSHSFMTTVTLSGYKGNY